MSQSVLSQLYGLGFVLLFVGFAVMRRMRPQPVRPQRLMVTGAIIVLLVAFSLVGSGGRIIADPLALVLVPVFAAAGVALGYYLVRTMRFWTDTASGALWMRGGALFALILVGTIAVRFAVRGIAYGTLFGPSGGSGFGPQPSGSRGLLYDLSADLLFLTLGLWAARAYFLIQRHRAHEAALQTTPEPGVQR
jgi:hypothetical protein